MKFIGLLLLVLGTRLAFAQEKEPPSPSDLSAHKCVYKNTFSDSARLTLYPFSTYRTVRLVSFRFHPNNLPVGDSKFERDSLVQDVALSKKQLLQLTDILYNNHTEGEVPSLESLCSFEPRNAILFFDINERSGAYILICFHCMSYKKSHDDINFGEDCNEKLKNLRKFFVRNGVTFGTNTNTDRFPGETRSGSN